LLSIRTKPFFPKERERERSRNKKKKKTKTKKKNSASPQRATIIKNDLERKGFLADVDRHERR
jgi:hypothetical protein